jgi:GT2 family glycosyltransferase
MSLIGMAVYDTEENKRTDFTERTIESLLATVDFTKHTLFIVDNNSCAETHAVYIWLKDYIKQTFEATGQKLKIEITRLDENVGTANAVNKALQTREAGEHFIKLDNDVVFHKQGWVDEMEEVITRMPKVGVLGLKRRDVCESTYALNPDQRSRLLEVPHANGEKWYVVEQCKHVMGTCTMLNSAMLDKVGYFYQLDGLYGFDDSLMCVRASKAGYINAFMHGVDIDHIDPGGTEYTKWKEEYAKGLIEKYAECERMYNNGMKDIYYNPFLK